MSNKLFCTTLVCIATLLGLPLAAQTPQSAPSDQTDLSTYQGPGIASPGVGDLGTASGQPADLRFYAGITGIYDTNIQPFITDSKGNLVRVPALWGMSFNGGAYGSQAWHHSQLSLSYAGDYRYYPDTQGYDGTNQSLALGFTTQFSGKWVFDARLIGFTLSQTTGSVANTAAATGAALIAAPFDTRSSGITGSASLTYLQTTRTSYTFGGYGNDSIYKSSLLTDYMGGGANASFTHRVSQSSSIGARYSFNYQTASTGAFEMKFHSAGAQFNSAFGRGWSFSLDAGVSIVQLNETVGLQVPVLFNNGTFGIANVLVPYKTTTIYPNGMVSLRRQFRQAVFNVNGGESVAGGNGLVTGARSESARAGISYSGLRKWNFGLDGGYTKLTSIGVGISQTKPASVVPSWRRTRPTSRRINSACKF